MAQNDSGAIAPPRFSQSLEAMKSLKQVFDEINYADVFFGSVVDSVHTERNFGETALHIVAIWGDVEAIAVLVENGADINKQGEEGFTPLHYAAEQDHLEAVQCLISLGAKNLRNVDGDTPKELAQVLGHDAIFNYLSNHGF
jgi:uncharacterized protein